MFMTEFIYSYRSARGGGHSDWSRILGRLTFFIRYDIGPSVTKLVQKVHEMRSFLRIFFSRTILLIKNHVCNIISVVEVRILETTFCVDFKNGAS